MSELQGQIQDAMDELVGSGAERGLQVAVYRHGDLVVDAVAGVADPATGRPVTSGTPFYSYSVGKGVTATVAHVLVERGAFGYDTRIAELWPEFGAKGKEAATVRHALTHTVGVPGVPADTTPEDLCDWDKMCAAIADAEPWWEPGTKTGYHALTYGYIVGEIIRRATGKPISRVLLEDVATPLGVERELFFGVPASEQGRLARLEDQEGTAEFIASMPKDSPFFAAAPLAVFPTADFGNRPDVLGADIPAGCKNSARAVARMYAALMGEVDGIRLISADRLRQVSTVSASGVDQVAGNEAAWGLGFGIGGLGPDGSFGMAGAGGSHAYGHAGTGVAFALAKNRLTGFDTVEQIIGIVTKAVANG